MSINKQPLSNKCLLHTSKISTPVPLNSKMSQLHKSPNKIVTMNLWAKMTSQNLLLLLIFWQLLLIIIGYWVLTLSLQCLLYVRKKSNPIFTTCNCPVSNKCTTLSSLGGKTESLGKAVCTSEISMFLGENCTLKLKLDTFSHAQNTPRIPRGRYLVIFLKREW